jgi:hypothetical protein
MIEEIITDPNHIIFIKHFNYGYGDRYVIIGNHILTDVHDFAKYLGVSSRDMVNLFLEFNSHVNDNPGQFLYKERQDAIDCMTRLDKMILEQKEKQTNG